jgi:predicted RNase H-like nuclease (RuvC/YqgF family)
VLKHTCFGNASFFVLSQSLLEAIEKMSLDAMPKNPRRGVGELVSFKEEARAKQAETDRLENTNRRLADEVNTLKSRLESAERSERQHSAAAAKDAADYDSANSGRIRSLESDLADAKDEVNRKVSETTQFQQMRKMMQSQANTIKYVAFGVSDHLTPTHRECLFIL